jgi:hypothetical protein
MGMKDLTYMKVLLAKEMMIIGAHDGSRPK